MRHHLLPSLLPKAGGLAAIMVLGLLSACSKDDGGSSSSSTDPGGNCYPTYYFEATVDGETYNYCFEPTVVGGTSFGTDEYSSTVGSSPIRYEPAAFSMGFYKVYLAYWSGTVDLNYQVDTADYIEYVDMPSLYPVGSYSVGEPAGFVNRQRYATVTLVTPDGTVYETLPASQQLPGSYFNLTGMQIDIPSGNAALGYVLFDERMEAEFQVQVTGNKTLTGSIVTAY